jgi:hypothetical protein
MERQPMIADAISKQARHQMTSHRNAASGNPATEESGTEESGTSHEQNLSAAVKGSHAPLEVSAGIQERITESLKLAHSVTSETRRTTTQTVEYVLPAGKVTLITTFWKQLWQEYEFGVRLSSKDDIAWIPYRVAADVTFDQSVQHIHAD